MRPAEATLGWAQRNAPSCANTGAVGGKLLDSGERASLQTLGTESANRGFMIFFSIGLPSRFAELCDALTARLAEHCLGSVASGSFNSFEDIATAVIRSDAAHLVAASRQPVVRLQTEIVGAGRPFLVALGDVRSALGDLLQRPDYDIAVATREIASSCAAMLTLTKAPGALVLPGAHGGDPVRLAAAIAGHFGFVVAPTDLAAIAAAVADLGAGVQETAWTDGLSEREQVIVGGALQPYVGYFAGGELEPIVWEPDLFFTNEDRADGRLRPAVRPIDVTGRARILIFGPYINLPPGAWSATIVTAFSAETAGNSFVVEVTAGVQLGYERVQPAGEQVIEINLQFTIDESISQPVEIRLISERAAFDGRLVLGYVSLAPRREVRTETHQQLIETLHR
jgi:hypothetical protein